MSDITSLSPEIIRMILEYLPQRSLITLSIAIKALRPDIEPILYRSIEHIFEDGRPDTCMPLLRLIRTFMARPELALHVRKLYIGKNTTPRNVGPIDVNILPKEHDIVLNDVNDAFSAIQHCLREASPKAPLPFWSSKHLSLLNGQLEVGCGDSVVAVLLSRLHNLEVLTIDWSFAYQASFVETLLKHSNCSFTMNGSHPRFSRLKELYLLNDRDRECMSFVSFFNYWPMNLQCLERLEMVMRDNINTFPAHAIQAPLPNLRTLCLHNSAVTPGALANILSKTPCLHTFEYNFVQILDELRHDDEHEYGHYNEWGDLKAALRPLASTLTSLIISVDNAYLTPEPVGDDQMDWACGVWKRRGHVGSLKGFTRLEKLEIPLPVLLGWTPDFPNKKLRNALPPSLKELLLRDDLVDMDIDCDYEWTPWYYRDSGDGSDDGDNQSVDGYQDDGEETPMDADQLDERFEENCYIDPILEQLSDYLAPSIPRSLQTLTIKQLQGREWPVFYIKEVRKICQKAQVTCKFHTRLNNLGDEVRESIEGEVFWIQKLPGTVLKKPYEQRLIFEKRRTFYQRLCPVRDEGALNKDLRDTKESGFFVNFPVEAERQHGE